MAASFERKLGRRPLELDDPSDVNCRTFAIKFFLTRPLRMVPAGVLAHRALQIGPATLSTRTTTRATRKFLVRYLSLPPTPPARPAHHIHCADRFHGLRPPLRLAHVQTSHRLRLGTRSAGQMPVAAMRGFGAAGGAGGRVEEIDWDLRACEAGSVLVVFVART
jgi:hypothetical protein